jgi:hypothetical protein
MAVVTLKKLPCQSARLMAFTSCPLSTAMHRAGSCEINKRVCTSAAPTLRQQLPVIEGNNIARRKASIYDDASTSSLGRRCCCSCCRAETTVWARRLAWQHNG